MPTKHKRYKLLDKHADQQGKAQKYAQEAGTGCHAHFSPLLPGSWRKHLKAKRKNPVYGTEGEKKGDCACKKGLATFAVGGVYNITNKDGELIDELAAIDWEDRDLIIFFDSDAATNIHVMNARNRWARLFMQRGANVYWIALPSYAAEKVGLDDYLQKQGKAKFLKLPRVLLTAEDVLADVHRHLTDVGNANRFVEHVGDRWIYVPELGAWFFWDGCRWCIDKIRRLFQEAIAAVLKIYKEAALEKDDDRRKRIAGWAVKSESEPRLNAMISLARSDPSVVVTQDRIDSDPLLLGVLNGVVDLRTGRLNPALPSQFITKQAPIEFDQSVRAPNWLEFLTKVCCGDRSTIAYIRRAIGYTLTGCTGEQVLFFLHGNGQNGKSVLIETMSFILGDYSVSAPSSMLMKTHNEAIPNDVARLRGRRMAALSELDVGDRFNEAKIKLYTGSDEVPARFLHQEWFEFSPTSKIWIHGNHKPVIRGQDKGIWRRIVLLPFDYEILDSERVLDFAKNILYPEAAGILNWAIQGCLEWQKKGLAAPTIVKAQTAMYRDDSDILGDFIAECCDVDPTYDATASELYQAYTSFSDDRKERTMSSRMFGVCMGERFERLGTKRPVRYAGLKPKSKRTKRKSKRTRRAEGAGKFS
jgi:putative DNA primase/helicase